jgi:hypothetical protein
MRKLFIIPLLGLLLAAAPAGASQQSKVLQVRMKDPGCHWFYVGGGPNHRQYAKTLARTGPVTVVNYDEAALIFRGPAGFLEHKQVGQKITLTKKGLYTITMVKQAPDDNHLKLTIK